jgi:hypothetical protein
MKRKIQAEPSRTKFQRVSEIDVDGFTIVQGDLLKIKGEYGSKFKFYSLTKNIETGAEWIDCFEISRGQIGAFRSFKPDRIKRIPQKGKRAKRVNH